MDSTLYDSNQDPAVTGCLLNAKNKLKQHCWCQAPFQHAGGFTGLQIIEAKVKNKIKKIK